jgi:hypothetical protein
MQTWISASTTRFYAIYLEWNSSDVLELSTKTRNSSDVLELSTKTRAWKPLNLEYHWNNYTTVYWPTFRLLLQIYLYAYIMQSAGSCDNHWYVVHFSHIQISQSSPFGFQQSESPLNCLSGCGVNGVVFFLRFSQISIVFERREDPTKRLHTCICYIYLIKPKNGGIYCILDWTILKVKRWFFNITDH